MLAIIGSFAAGIITGLLLYRTRERRLMTPVERIRECVKVIWCAHCGQPGSALCEGHKLPSVIAP